MNKPTPESLEQFISTLKDDGLSKTASIVRVATRFTIGLDAAKHCVHESLAWRDLKASHETFQSRLSVDDSSVDDRLRQDEK
jgi:hypothetical protein